jgi:hypothetical protein
MDRIKQIGLPCPVIACKAVYCRAEFESRLRIIAEIEKSEFSQVHFSAKVLQNDLKHLFQQSLTVDK